MSRRPLLLAATLAIACAAPSRPTAVAAPRGERPVLVGDLAGWGVRREPARRGRA